jgi:hypothetical protein
VAILEISAAFALHVQPQQRTETSSNRLGTSTIELYKPFPDQLIKEQGLKGQVLLLHGSIQVLADSWRKHRASVEVVAGTIGW